VAELPQIGTKVNPIELPGPKTYHIEGWSAMRDEKRHAVLRQIALRRGRDPRIATLVIQIIREAGCQPREYVKQAAALLTWVQNPKNCYYVNEPGERLQDPLCGATDPCGAYDHRQLTHQCVWLSSVQWCQSSG
jgi:hypothetical protein